MKETIELKPGYTIINFKDNLGKEVRTLFTGNSYQSVTYTNEFKYELYDKYTNLYKICDTHKDKIDNCLVLGGGCFSYPKYYISKYKDKKMDVVELDSYMIDISNKYFFLDDLYKEYDPLKERLNIYIQDALQYIKECNNLYDSILIDLFIDNKPLYEIFSVENLKHINNLMNDSAILAINYIITEEDANHELFNQHMNNLRKVYQDVIALVLPNFKEKNRGNVFILACQKEMNIKLPIEVYELN